MASEIRPGLLVLHGNRLELLTEAVFDWLDRAPLAPLETEHFLVQSNGAAEWLKMALARHAGLCAAARVELPARFLWRSYRLMLGRAAVPARSAFEKDALTWRLMRALPDWASRPGFETVAGFLQAGGADRRLQLAARLADLLDQYQVYRADWLAAWAEGRDELIAPGGQASPLPPDQRWQAALWRLLLAELSPPELSALRPQVHRDFLAALARDQAPVAPLPRRVVLLGAAHLSSQALEALAALSRRCQVILAIPNPCRFHWADILEGRELLRTARPRHAARGAQDLGRVPLAAMHDHAHPLLAAWGRQGRDFMRQLDAFDETQAHQRAIDLPRIDLFDDGPGDTLLTRLQASVRDLVPLAEHPALSPDAQDGSIVFNIGHSPQREVEILHDQLLQLLARPATASQDRPLAPRDVVVMAPDIALFAPAIRAVFGQHGRDDARFIPFEIADLPRRGSNPVLLALEWLLRADAQRFTASELRDLLEVPAISQRLGLHADALPGLARWIAASGVRWGLHTAQRDSLGLGASGEQNSWLFGLRRLLLGYASGAAPAFDGITPFDDIGGLEADSLGALVDLVEQLDAWWSLARQDASASAWAERCRALMAAWFAPSDERERLTLAALNGALAGWLAACDSAGFESAVPLSVLREAWLGALDANGDPTAGGGARFLAGGVTFCTLMPLRAIPFEVVCLIGMNDGDYPRQTRRNDFDLMGLAGQQRPGDRSRRDDDRYLMLEAVLSARRVLSISWSGRSQRDNSAQPPSVLVAQLRDYLVAAYPATAPGQPADQVLRQRSTEHPLQAFSRRYFEARRVGARLTLPQDAAPPALFTYAREWRAAHQAGDEAAAPAVAPVLPPFDAQGVALTVNLLARFLANPVKEFFRSRLDVVFQPDDDALDDEEAFALDGLSQYALLSELLAQAVSASAATTLISSPASTPAQALPAALARMQGRGVLPIAALGPLSAQALSQWAQPMLATWGDLRAQQGVALPPQPLRFAHQGVVLDDWLTGLHSAGGGAGASANTSAGAGASLSAGGGACLSAEASADASDHALPIWLDLSASVLLQGQATKKGSPALRLDRLLQAWVRMLAASAVGNPVRGHLVARDLVLSLQPLPQAQAAEHLRNLMAAWQDGMNQPLPVAASTALAWAGDRAKALPAYEGGYQQRAERLERCLARVYPDFAALSADGRFASLATQLYAPVRDWASTQVSATALADAGPSAADDDEAGGDDA